MPLSGTTVQPPSADPEAPGISPRWGPTPRARGPPGVGGRDASERRARSDRGESLFKTRKPAAGKPLVYVNPETAGGGARRGRAGGRGAGVTLPRTRDRARAQPSPGGDHRCPRRARLRNPVRDPDTRPRPRTLTPDPSLTPTREPDPASSIPDPMRPRTLNLSPTLTSDPRTSDSEPKPRPPPWTLTSNPDLFGPLTPDPDPT